MEAMQADKEVVIAGARAVALKWLLDSGVGLTNEGEPDEREISSRMEEVVAAVEKAWAEGLEMLEEDDDCEAEIPAHIEVYDLDDDEIKEWVNNDEGLYNWAKSEGAIE